MLKNNNNFLNVFFKKKHKYQLKLLITIALYSIPILAFSALPNANLVDQTPKVNFTTHDLLIIIMSISFMLAAFLGLQWWKLKQLLLKSNLASQQLIWHQANYDDLTELPNRRMFQKELIDSIERSKETGLPMALLLLDLDGFKQINDSLGHATGDMLLTEVGRRISNCLYSNDIVARLGGDEFTIILEKVKNISSIEAIANKILTSLNQPFSLKEHTIHISTSIGITLYPVDTVAPDTLLKSADQAMYAAKSLGKNCYQFFTPMMQKTIDIKVKRMQELRLALPNKEFELHYQPIVELSTGKTVKAEALIRWNHPTNGCIGPLDFIPIVEESGLIVPIGDWAFNQASAFLKKVQRAHHADFQISINVSPKQFQSSNMIDGKHKQFWKTTHAVKGIIIEITESLVLDLTDKVREQFSQIKEAGIETAIDDFGTGYSSLAYLKKFNLDYIKIDRSFVSNIETNDSDRVLCEVIVEMANKLGFKVVAEGIETKAQLDFLQSIGCCFGQGFYLSKPLPEDEFLRYIKNT